MADFEHLRIEREPLENDRRTRKINMPRHPRGDLGGHGQKLTNDLTQALLWLTVLRLELQESIM